MSEAAIGAEIGGAGTGRRTRARGRLYSWTFVQSGCSRNVWIGLGVFTTLSSQLRV